MAMGDRASGISLPTSRSCFRGPPKVWRLSTAQQKDVRARVAATRQETFGRFSATGQAHLRTDVCKPDERVRLETMLGRISFE
jgi:hypothetical protein